MASRGSITGDGTPTKPTADRADGELSAPRVGPVGLTRPRRSRSESEPAEQRDAFPTAVPSTLVGRVCNGFDEVDHREARTVGCGDVVAQGVPPPAKCICICLLYTSDAADE